jgi:HrpA-like RNA helicase
MLSNADSLKRKIESSQKRNSKRRITVQNLSKRLPLPPLPDELPIAALKEQLVASVMKYSTTIVVGETGSGKSTQLVQYLVDDYLTKKSISNNRPKDAKAKPSCIACTQPRRVAAVTIAQRVAFERNVAVGDEVGYSIRFEDKTSSKTRIKFVTDGVLLRECMSNPDLENYDVIILDEAHERSLQTDILIGLLRQLQDRRPSLRLVIMSATLQVELFMEYFKVLFV